MKTFALALLFAYVVAPFVSAHEGHDHKIMGTLSAVHENSVEVKATDGKQSTITLNDKTKILRGATALKLADLKTGDRVVVTATGGGKDPFVAKQIKVGGAITATATTKPAAAKK
jgi:hypothetical protein